MTGPALNLLLMLISPPCNQHVRSYSISVYEYSTLIISNGEIRVNI